MKLRLREIVVACGFLGAAAGPCLADTFTISYFTFIDGVRDQIILGVPWVPGSSPSQQFSTPVGTTLTIDIVVTDTTAAPFGWEILNNLSGPPGPEYSDESTCRGRASLGLLAAEFP